MSFQPLLGFLKPGATTWKITNMKSLSLTTIITNINLQVQRALAFVRFAEPKSSYNIIFRLIITKIKPIVLQTLSLIFLKEIPIRKKSSKLETQKCYTGYISHLLMPTFLISISILKRTSPYYIRFLFAKLIFYLNTSVLKYVPS